MTWGVAEVVVQFGHKAALERVSLPVGSGQVAVVVGGDGAGKTTLCRAMVGLQQLSGGEVSRPERIGFQPASSGVWRDLTVMENLRLVAGAYRLEPSHASARIDELLEVTRLAEASDRLGGELSGGMRQKLGVAMAVLSEPQLLVLDEPTTGVDPVSRLELWSFIMRSAREDRAVVVTTTYVDEARRGNRVLALDAGRPLAEGTPEAVLDSMPGSIYESTLRPSDSRYSWRRGRDWRVWSESGANPDGLRRVVPDMADVVTVAALRNEGR